MEKTEMSAKKKLLLLCVGLVVGFIIIMVCVINFYDSDTTSNNSTNTEDNLDGLQGTWAKADKTTGIVDKSSYLSFDGKGNVTQYISGYSFKHEYTFDDKVYYDDWACSLKSTSYSDGSKQFRLECWSGSSSAIFIKQ